MNKLAAITCGMVLMAGTAAAQPKGYPVPNQYRRESKPSHRDRGERSTEALKPYSAQDFSGLLGMKGFSDKALNAHFKLYGGYVKNTNKLLDILGAASKEGGARGPDVAEMQRRLGWEFDGMRLHELYFENLGGSGPLDRDTDLYQRIVRDFGSYDSWKQNFMAIGATRGIGWVILYDDPRTGRLINTWINEHDGGHPAGASPLLIMDVWEHAYIFDYGLDRGAYIKAFMENVDWKKVTARADG